MLSTELLKQQVLVLFLSPKERISRGLFWKANLVLWLGFLSLLCCVTIVKEVFKLPNIFQDSVYSFIVIVYFYAVFVLTIKRLHDINWSGWLAVPCILTGILWLVIGLIAGTSKNKYGDNSVEYEKNRLYVNRGTSLPPPPPPLDNPISKIILYAMMILPIPSLVMAGMVMPENVEKPAVEQATSSEKEVVSIAEETLPFDVQKGDQYQKVEAADGIDAYYVVTKSDGTIEHYALDGTLQWSNVEHEEEQTLADDMPSANLLASSAPGFAEDYFLINESKIGLHESKETMIAKLGKPTFEKNNVISWGTHDISEISAEFDQYGLIALSTSKGAIVINGQTITIGKDTPNTIKPKVQQYCEAFDRGKMASQYSQSTRVGAEGEIYISFDSYGDGNTSDQTFVSKPIESINLGYEDLISYSASSKCNY